jgi:tRNA(fMet)-specific endonuclease VapC
MLRNQNKIIETKDLFIAATALSHDLPLMTLNVKHFERIEAMKIV